MNTMDRLRVDPEQLRWTLPPSQLGFATTDEVTPCAVTPGQNRAVRALELGLALRGHGYNVYVAGDPGTNRSVTVRYLLDCFQDAAYAPRISVSSTTSTIRTAPRFSVSRLGEDRSSARRSATRWNGFATGYPASFRATST